MIKFVVDRPPVRTTFNAFMLNELFPLHLATIISSVADVEARIIVGARAILLLVALLRLLIGINLN